MAFKYGLMPMAQMESEIINLSPNLHRRFSSATLLMESIQDRMDTSVSRTKGSMGIAEERKKEKKSVNQECWER